MIATNGTVYVAGNNRYSAAPEPHVRFWGVGFPPSRLQRDYVRSSSGHSYDRLRLLSVLRLRAAHPMYSPSGPRGQRGQIPGQMNDKSNL